jgi:hypothetical protein
MINIQDAVVQSLNGVLPGAIFGAVLSAGVYISNNLLFEKQPPIVFKINDKQHQLYIPESLEGYTFLDSIHKIRTCNQLNLKLYNRFIILVQKIMIIHEKFIATNDNRHKIHYMAKFEHQCMAIDVTLRLLAQASNNIKQQETITKESVEIHTLLEQIISVLRDEVAANDNIKSVPPPVVKVKY